MKIKISAIVLALITLTMCGTITHAQMAPIQLTNPSVDAVNGDQSAAWVADENMGVLYCELVRETPTAAKRVACYDSRGEVAPRREASLRN